MAKTKVQEGKRIEVTADAAVDAGGLVRIGSLIGVALSAAAVGEKVVIATGEVWELPKTSALAISVGDNVYMGATNSVVNKTATARFRVGVAVEAAANPSPSVKVLVNPGMAAAAG